MNIYKDGGGNEIPQGVAFTSGDFSFAANWLGNATPDDLIQFGITLTVVADPEPEPVVIPPEPTPAEKLEAATGLTPAQLKALLASA